MDRSGDHKRKAPEGSSSNRLVLEPDWLSPDTATPYRCHICLRAFTSQYALGGHYNAHRSKRFVPGAPWQSQVMKAQLRAIWQRQGRLLWNSMARPRPSVPIAQPLQPVPVARPSPNPIYYQVRQPTDTVFRVPVEAEACINVSKREGKMPVYAPGRQNPLILHDRSTTARGESNYLQAAKKQKMVYAPGASSSTSRPIEGLEVLTEKKRKVVQVGPVPVHAPGPSRFGPHRRSSKAETLDLELRL